MIALSKIYCMYSYAVMRPAFSLSSIHIAPEAFCNPCVESAALAKPKRELDHPWVVKTHAFLRADTDRRAKEMIRTTRLYAFTREKKSSMEVQRDAMSS